VSYTPNPTWEDGSAGGTPFEAAPFNHIEAGILDASNRLDSLYISNFSVAAQYLKIGPTLYSFSAVGGGSSYAVIDKTSTPNDASVYFRTTGIGRGEVGLAADDDMHFKVVTGSVAGSETFVDGLIIKNAAPNTGKVWAPVGFGVGTVPAVPLHIAGSSTSGRVAAKVENTNVTASTSAGSQLEFKGNSAPVDWVLGTDYGANGGNNYFLQDGNGGLRLFVDGNGRIVIGDYTAGAATNNSLDVVGSIRTRGTNYSLNPLNFCGHLTAPGAPTTGTYAVHDVVMDSIGIWYICTGAGTPGTWARSAGDPNATKAASMGLVGMTEDLALVPSQSPVTAGRLFVYPFVAGLSATVYYAIAAYASATSGNVNTGSFIGIYNAAGTTLLGATADLASQLTTVGGARVIGTMGTPFALTAGVAYQAALLNNYTTTGPQWMCTRNFGTNWGSGTGIIPRVQVSSGTMTTMPASLASLGLAASGTNQLVAIGFGKGP
jgi:hypothetical protein